MTNTPQNYQDIVYPSDAVAQYVEALVTNKIEFPSNGKTGILLHGPVGTGKTTLAHLLPAAIEQVRTGSPNVFPVFTKVLPGDNGDELIQRYKNIAETNPINGRWQYIVMDEVDGLKPGAASALKLVMEMPTALFIMTTNRLNKVPEPVQSRCHVIHMTEAPAERWLLACRRALTTLGAKRLMPDELLLPVIAACRGDARNLMTQMQVIAAQI